MNELVFNQPEEVNAVHFEFFGNTEQAVERAKSYMGAARVAVGTMQAIYGIKEMNEQYGAFYSYNDVLADGTQISVSGNSGQYTARITCYDRPTPEVEREINPILPKEELPIVPVYDEGGVEYAIWLLRYVTGASGSMVLEQWDFANGYTGGSVFLPAISETNNISGVLIFNGYVWWAELNAADGIVYRTSIKTKVQQTLYTRSSGLRRASTVTPLGVLFAIGNIDNLSFILFKEDGSVVYDVAYSGPGMEAVNYLMTSFVNDGAHAYLHQGDGARFANRLTIIEIATGAHTTVITHQLSPEDEASYAWPSVDDYRGICYAAVVDGDVMYEATIESGYYVNSRSKLRLRDPSTSITSSVLTQLTDYDPGNPPPSALWAGAGGMVEDGLIVIIHADTLMVVDPASKSILSASATPFVGAAPCTSIIPDSSSVAILYNRSDDPHLALYNPKTGAVEDYLLNPGYVHGYLLQITINAASNPGPTLPPLKEEWEYLSATNVNPI